MVVSNICYFHPYLGKIPIFTNIFSNGLKPPTRLLSMCIMYLLFLYQNAGAIGVIEPMASTFNSFGNEFHGIFGCFLKWWVFPPNHPF